MSGASSSVLSPPAGPRHLYLSFLSRSIFCLSFHIFIWAFFHCVKHSNSSLPSRSLTPSILLSLTSFNSPSPQSTCPTYDVGTNHDVQLATTLLFSGLKESLRSSSKTGAAKCVLPARARTTQNRGGDCHSSSLDSPHSPCVCSHRWALTVLHKYLINL